MSRRGATADWPLEVGERTSELGLEAAARTVADSSRGPIADRETCRRQPALVAVEVVALLVVHREIQMVVVPRVARPETHKAADRRVVRRETQRASVVGYSRWGSVASQAALEAVGEEGCPSCGRTSRCRRGPGLEPRREGEQAPGCSRAAARTEVGTREREGPR